jgi:hypothetical protein
MKNVSTKWVVVGVGLAALLLAGIVSYYASSSPDGLTKVSEDKGFANTEKEHGAADSPLAGYATKDVDNERLSGGLAGVIGVVVVLVLASGVVYVVRRRKATDEPAHEHEPVS